MIKEELVLFQQSSKNLYFKSLEVCKIADSISFKESMDKFIKNISSQLYRYIHPDLPKYFRKSIYTKLSKRIKPDSKYKEIESLLECLTEHIKIQHNLTQAQIQAQYDILDIAPTESFIVADLSSFMSKATVKKYKKIIDNAKKEQLLNANHGVPTLYRYESMLLSFNKQADGSVKRNVDGKIQTLNHHQVKSNNSISTSVEFTNGFKVPIEIRSTGIVVYRIENGKYVPELKITPTANGLSVTEVISVKDIIEIIEFDIDETPTTNNHGENENE
ncbi:hypothetical protein ACCE15_19185 [Pseudomonas parafulva]|uniref:hypothetical protein n=1 Tax=Pseudomonas parafulva TaxID=157782 RepID=UPI003566324E